MNGNKGISLIILALIIALVLAVGAVAIVLVMNKDNKPNNTNETSKVENNLVNNQQSNRPIAEDTTLQTDEYEGYAKVSGKEIYVNYKNGRRDDVKSSSIVFHNEKTYLSVLAYDKEETYNGTLDNVFNLLNDGRIFKDIATYSLDDFHNYNKTYLINKTSEKKVKIGEVDAIKFDGNVLDEQGNSCYIYGYTFIMDETPCMLAGCVFSKEQENSSIQNMRKEVDTMIATVRNKR